MGKGERMRYDLEFQQDLYNQLDSMIQEAQEMSRQASKLWQEKDVLETENKGIEAGIRFDAMNKKDDRDKPFYTNAAQREAAIDKALYEDEKYQANVWKMRELKTLEKEANMTKYSLKDQQTLVSHRIRGIHAFFQVETFGSPALKEVLHGTRPANAVNG